MQAAAENRSAAAPELVITRIFDAPRELVWRCWTEAEHLQKWGAPHGFTVTHCEGELKPGGRWRACMRSPEGKDLWNGGVYREIVAPERLVYTFAWDEDGHESLVTVMLKDLGDRTEMTFRHGPFESVESRDGHKGGWSEAFEKLAAHAGGLAAGGT